MAIETALQNDELIIRAIKNEIKSETERLIKNAIKEIEKEMEKRTPEIIAGIIVDIMQMSEFQTLQDRIIFTIKKKKL